MASQKKLGSRVLRLLGYTVVVLALTALTQIGGIVFLLSWWWLRRQQFSMHRRWLRRLCRSAVFVGIYLLISVSLVPWLAAMGGRVALPSSGDQVRPANVMTCLLNRHYVKEELYNVTFDLANRLQAEDPSVVVTYLDANLPFLDGFPLLPHLSHNDGKKIDLAFIYKDQETGKVLSGFSPSLTGYGIFEEPTEEEKSTKDFCREEGYWQYNFTSLLGWELTLEKWELDASRTRKLVAETVAHQQVGKVFIEPHLKKRWGLANKDKIRFHGCGAVRHDDHIHLQLR